MSDVLITTVGLDGPFTLQVINGITVTTGRFETATVFSLFGGNFEDDGRPGNRQTYWGNFLETEDARKLVSRTQHILESLPATSSNLIRVEEAARLDLAWFLDLNIASSVTVVATIPALNRIKLTVTITAQGEEHQFSFVENWKATA